MSAAVVESQALGDPFGRSTPIVDTPEKVKAALDRIVRIRVSGTARDGARLVSSHADIANVVARPGDVPVPDKTAAAPAQRAATTLSGEELIEAAKLGLFEKMYESGAKTYRTQLAGRGLSEKEVEDRLFQAMDAFKSRTVSCNKVMYDQLGLTFF